MSLTQLSEHYQTDFGDLWSMEVQQKRSLLANAVRIVNVNGKERTFSRLGKNTMRAITERNGETTPSDTAMYKRWLRLQAYDEVTYIDEFDDLSLGELSDTRSEHLISHTYAANRKQDEIILDALSGNAQTGITGSTSTALPSGQIVAVDYVASGAAANSGLTLAKILRTREIMNINQVPQENRYMVISSSEEADLLTAVDEAKSSDYTNVKAMIDGSVIRLAGFDFIRSELLTISGADVTTCLAFQGDAVVLGIGSDKKATVDRLPTKSDTIQVRTVMSLGATRLDELSTVIIYADRSP